MPSCLMRHDFRSLHINAYAIFYFAAHGISRTMPRGRHRPKRRLRRRLSPPIQRFSSAADAAGFTSCDYRLSISRRASLFLYSSL